MSSNVKPIPDGYHTVTPYLIVEGVAELIDFLKQAFDAVEKERLPGPDGKVGHAEVRIGDSVVMMGEAGGEWKPVPGAMYLYVNDTDATYKRALEAGATSLMEPADQFYGDRNARREGPVRQHVVDRHAQGGCIAGGIAEACRSSRKELGPLT
jgi:PhnB protein